jgi:hypothetical protein
MPCQCPSEIYVISTGPQRPRLKLGPFEFLGASNRTNFVHQYFSVEKENKLLIGPILFFYVLNTVLNVSK